MTYEYEAELDPKLAAFIRALPKAELHVHLEGSIRPATLLQLAKRHNIILPANDEAGLREFYRFRDFNHFIEVWMVINECLRSGADFELITAELGAAAAQQNIRYLEVTFTPYPHYRRRALAWDELFAGINAGRAAAQRQWGVEMRLIPDISRNSYEEGRMYEAEKTAEWAVSGKEAGVVALGLGGREIGNPPEAFTEAFAFARAGGLHSIPHAGETSDAANIWGAIDSLKAERIGHGIRCVQDPALVDYLIQHQLPLEICPTSNICTRAIDTLADHPIRKLYDSGVYVTLNSDDPPMFNTTLTTEYMLLAARFGFSAAELAGLSLNAVRASFLPDSEKQQLEQQFRGDIESLSRQL